MCLDCVPSVGTDCLPSLADFVLTAIPLDAFVTFVQALVHAQDFIMSMLDRALHLHTACSIFSLEELCRDADFHLQCSWCRCSRG